MNSILHHHEQAYYETTSIPSLLSLTPLMTFIQAQNTPETTLYSCFGKLSNDTSVCSGRGNCTSTDHCVCFNPNGYYGSKCERTYCAQQNDCSGHGECFVQGVCDCHYGWGNSNCSAFHCSDIGGCAPTTGSCTGPNVCTCVSGYLPPTCKEYSCYGISYQNQSVCSGKGTCTRPNTCECKAFYGGNRCEITTCAGIASNLPTVCSSHGNCLEYEVCSCHDGYTGLRCQYPYCFGIASNNKNVCSGKGSCVSPDVCKCAAGYAGMKCSLSLNIVNRSGYVMAIDETSSLTLIDLNANRLVQSSVLFSKISTAEVCSPSFYDFSTDSIYQINTASTVTTNEPSSSPVYYLSKISLRELSASDPLTKNIYSGNSLTPNKNASFVGVYYSTLFDCVYMLETDIHTKQMTWKRANSDGSSLTSFRINSMLNGMKLWSNSCIMKQQTTDFSDVPLSKNGTDEFACIVFNDSDATIRLLVFAVHRNTSSEVLANLKLPFNMTTDQENLSLFLFPGEEGEFRIAYSSNNDAGVVHFLSANTTSQFITLLNWTLSDLTISSKYDLLEETLFFDDSRKKVLSIPRFYSLSAFIEDKPPYLTYSVQGASCRVFLRRFTPSITKIISQYPNVLEGGIETRVYGKDLLIADWSRVSYSYLNLYQASSKLMLCDSSMNSSFGEEACFVSPALNSNTFSDLVGVKVEHLVGSSMVYSNITTTVKYNGVLSLSPIKAYSGESVIIEGVYFDPLHHHFKCQFLLSSSGEEVTVSGTYLSHKYVTCILPILNAIRDENIVVRVSLNGGESYLKSILVLTYQVNLLRNKNLMNFESIEDVARILKAGNSTLPNSFGQPNITVVKDGIDNVLYVSSIFSSDTGNARYSFESVNSSLITDLQGMVEFKITDGSTGNILELWLSTSSSKYYIQGQISVSNGSIPKIQLYYSFPGDISSESVMSELGANKIPCNISTTQYYKMIIELTNPTDLKNPVWHTSLKVTDINPNETIICKVERALKMTLNDFESIRELQFSVGIAQSPLPELFTDTRSLHGLRTFKASYQNALILVKSFGFRCQTEDCSFLAPNNLLTIILASVLPSAFVVIVVLLVVFIVMLLVIFKPWRRLDVVQKRELEIRRNIDRVMHLQKSMSNGAAMKPVRCGTYTQKPANKV